MNGWDGVSHPEFWSHVLEHLAGVWGKDARLLKRRLRDRRIGLPRDRVVHPGSGYVAIHGNDAHSAMEDRLEVANVRFRLTEVEVTPEFSEREKMLAEDSKAVQAVLGIPLDLKTTA